MRYVQVDAIKTQLEMGNVVLLSNLTYSAAGEILCCNIYDVATHAAIELGAEKLICLTQQASYLHSYKEFKLIHSPLSWISCIYISNQPLNNTKKKKKKKNKSHKLSAPCTLLRMVHGF